MKALTINETREIVGGASKYVYCPICGYKSKSSLIERLFWSNSRRKLYLQAVHGYARNGYGQNTSQSAHSK